MSSSLDDDPTDFEGQSIILQSSSEGNVRNSKSNAATGASAASVRAISAQVVAFYFRAPIKAFFRTRVDYLAYAKAINPRLQAGGWSWQTTTPGLLAHAVRTYGWRFLPDHVLPPMVANVAIGAVLYTSYLQNLGRLYDPSSHSTKRVYPPPPPERTFAAGFFAGGIQSLVAAPMDALQVRFDKSEMLHRNTMLQYARHKLHEVGVRGVFASWGLSFFKDSLGAAAFFSTFEFVKAQFYYSFVRWYYGSLRPSSIIEMAPTTKSRNRDVPTIKPHYALEPCFLMGAGITASVAQQIIQHPLGMVQNLHYERLEVLDHQASLRHSKKEMLRHYYHAYHETLRECKTAAAIVGGMRTWLFRGFLINTIKQVPSTSAGLIIFELVRRKYGTQAEAVMIQKDGYDILLS